MDPSRLKCWSRKIRSCRRVSTEKKVTSRPLKHQTLVTVPLEQWTKNRWSVTLQDLERKSVRRARATIRWPSPFATRHSIATTLSLYLSAIRHSWHGALTACRKAAIASPINATETRQALTCRQTKLSRLRPRTRHLVALELALALRRIIARPPLVPLRQLAKLTRPLTPWLSQTNRTRLARTTQTTNRASKNRSKA